MLNVPTFQTDAFDNWALIWFLMTPALDITPTADALPMPVAGDS